MDIALGGVCSSSCVQWRYCDTALLVWDSNAKIQSMSKMEDVIEHDAKRSAGSRIRLG